MRRNVCVQIEEIKGTKSTKIMELINRKLQEEKEKMLKAHIKDKRLNDLYKRYEAIKLEVDNAKKLLDKREEELDLEWTYDKKYKIVDRCRISKEDFELLQKAQDLFSIGKKNEANNIWVKMIEKHKLFQK